jgi:hypothetical protein
MNSDSWQMAYGRKYVEGYGEAERLALEMIDGSIAG